MIKKILIHAGIFTTVFALGAGAGFMLSYKKANDTVSRTIDTVATPMTASEQFLSNLVDSQALAGDISLSINSDTIGNIDLSVNNLQISISDLENVKVSGDINVKYDTLEVAASFGYFDNTVYVDYDNTHLYLETSNITDVMNMLPTWGLNLTIPDEFSSLDFDSLLSKLNNMEEFNDNGHYFRFNFSENIVLEFLSDDSFNMTGIRINDAEVMGMKLSASSNLHTLKEDITMINPSLRDNAPKYQNFRPTFTLVNSIMSLVNNKKATVSLTADVNKGEEDFFNVDGDLTFALDQKLSLFTDLKITEGGREHNIKAGYLDDSVLANYNTLKVSMSKASITDLATYIINKLPSKEEVTVIDQISQLVKEIDLKKILTYTNDLPEIASDLNISDNYLSITLKPEYFSLPFGPINLAVIFNEDQIESIKIDDFTYDTYAGDLEIKVIPYQEININKTEYVAIDPALTLLDGVDTLINQKAFHLKLNASIDFADTSKKSMPITGDVQFDLENKFGYGTVTLVDGDNYTHKIQADMKDESEILLSYNDKLNCYFSIQSLKDIYDIAMNLYNEKDDHFMELFGSLLDAAKNTPLAKLISNKDYSVLLNTDILKSIDVTKEKITLGLNAALIGYNDVDFTLVVRYQKDKVKGIDIVNLNIKGNVYNISVDINDFDSSIESGMRLTKDDSYLDLSDIKTLLEFGINTSKFNYYHFSGTLTVTILGIDINVNVDIKIRNNKGKVQILVSLPDIPTIIGVNKNSNYTNTDGRKAYVMYDNGDFYIQRIDETSGAFWVKKYYYTVSLKCDQDYFMDNILNILCQNVLGLSDSIMSQITSSSGEKGQIHYEELVNDFTHNTTDKYFYIDLNIGELAQNDDLKSLQLSIYHNDQNQLQSLKLTLNINVGISITLSGELALQSDTSIEINDSNKITYLEDYVSAHANDTLNTVLTKETSR